MNQKSPAPEIVTFLLAEDDPDDRFLTEEAFGASGIPGVLHFVEDGEQLMDYLLGRARYSSAGPSRRPSAILLDLNMPKKSGREALVEIRFNPELKDIPVIVLTTSDSEEDKKYCARYGVAEYVTKPSSFTEMIDLMKRIESFCCFR